MPGTRIKEKPELLKDASKILGKYQAVIKDLQAGETEVAACNRHHVNRTAFRRFVFHRRLDDDGTVINPAEADLDAVLIGPAERLYIDIFRIRTPDYENIPYDVEETLPFIMAKTLSPTRIHILTRFYWDGFTLDEIAQEVGLTKEAVRHNITRGLWLLRRPENKKICDAGLERYEAVLQGHKDLVDRIRAEDEVILADYADRMAKAAIESDMDKAKALYRTTIDAIARDGGKAKIDEDGLDRPVETMPLYNKTKLQCRLNGVNTVRDLGAMTIKEIARWPSIGDSAINQLIRVMDEEYGIHMR